MKDENVDWVGRAKFIMNWVEEQRKAIPRWRKIKRRRFNNWAFKYLQLELMAMIREIR